MVTESYRLFFCWPRWFMNHTLSLLPFLFSLSTLSDIWLLVLRMIYPTRRERESMSMQWCMQQYRTWIVDCWPSMHTLDSWSEMNRRQSAYKSPSRTAMKTVRWHPLRPIRCRSAYISASGHAWYVWRSIHEAQYWAEWDLVQIL